MKPLLPIRILSYYIFDGIIKAMFGKGSELNSIFFLKGSRCDKGDFLEANPYKLSNFNEVKERCPKCELKYGIEPSFYTSSMYVHYGVGIAVAVAVYIHTLLFDLDLKISTGFLLIVVDLVLAMPYIAAIS